MTKVLTFSVELIEPLLATGMEGDPNSGVGLDYVPGAVLRGAAIGKYNRKKCSHNDSFQRLFLNGTTKFLNGYPTLEINERSLPCPLSFFQDKHRENGCFGVEDHAVSDRDPSIRWQAVASGAPFVSLDADNARSVKPLRTVNIHTQRNRRKGRAISGSGAVFRYDSLAAGQVFISHVICTDDDAALLLDLLEGERCLGGSRTAGYGLVRIKATGEPASVERWKEFGELQIGNFGDVQKDTFVRLTLLSHAILRDTNTGQHSATIAALIANLPNEAETPPQVDRVYLKRTVIGGFNRRWGLPLPQTTALCMGSVIFLSGVSLNSKAVQRLLIEGIGERQSEGFGRVAIDWHVTPRIEMTSAAISLRSSVSSLAESADDENALLAVQSQIRRLRIESEIERQSLLISSARTLPVDCRTRLQGLRQAVKNELFSRVNTFISSRLEELLEHSEQRKTVREKYQRIQVKAVGGRQQTILAWMRHLLSNEQPVSIVFPDLKLCVKRDVALTAVESYRFRLSVVAKVLERLSKESKRLNSTGVER